MGKERDYAIDIAKGIGILLVIVGHCGISAVSTFHMAFFFILSGYFLSSKLPLDEFIKTRAKRLLIPYVYGVLFCIIGAAVKDIVLGNEANIMSDMSKWLCAGLYGKGNKGEFLLDGVNKIGAYWFLLAMFYGSVIVRRFLDNKHMIVIVTIIAYIGFATRQVVFLPFSIQNGMVAAFFIGVGVYCKRFDIFNINVDKSIVFSCLALWIFAIANNITMSMVGIKFPYGILNIIIAFSASFIVVKFSQFLDKRSQFIRKFLTFCGSNSLAILFFHAFEINILRWGWINTWLTPLGVSYLEIKIIECVLRIVLCVGCVVIARKVKIFKFLF